MMVISSGMPPVEDIGWPVCGFRPDTLCKLGGGALPIWATGFIASEPDVDYNALPLFLIDCRSRPGQSGSPVVAYRSGAVTTKTGAAMFAGPPRYRLLGIYSGRINDQSDVGMVWKVSAIQELVASV
jgi:hypothetical protein